MYPVHRIKRERSFARRLMHRAHVAPPEGRVPRECMHRVHSASAAVSPQNGRMGIKVRGGDSTDHAAAVEVWLSSVTARDEAPPADEIKRVVRANLAAPTAWLLVGEEDDAMVAFACARDGAFDGGRGAPTPGTCHIDMLFVLPDRWGTGVGGAILDATLHEAVRRGYVSAQLWVVQGNERATRLYARRGFRHSGRITTGDAGEEIGLWARRLT